MSAVLAQSSVSTIPCAFEAQTYQSPIIVPDKKELARLCRSYNFRLLESTALSDEFHLIRAIHKRGIEVLRLLTKNGSIYEPTVLVGFVTPPTDNKGHPHVREHLVFNHVPQLFQKVCASPLVSHLNACTYQSWTDYQIRTYDTKDLPMAREYLLKQIFNRDFNQQKLDDEIGRMCCELDSKNQRTIVWYGRLYAEMKGRSVEAGAIAWKSLQRLLFEKGSFYFDSGGEPEQIRKITLGSMQRFDRKCYRARNMVYGESGPHDLTETFASLDD